VDHNYWRRLNLSFIMFGSLKGLTLWCGYCERV